MNNIILQGINTNDLKEIFREVLAEKSREESKPKETSKISTNLTRVEVSKILRISLATLNNWSKEGIVQSYRTKNRVYYKAEEIDKVLQPVKNLKYKRG